ncbi:MAG: UDP-N-acetylmuramoyl-L-alanyl-D-glutamate--2,6-diaminopimelate ligase [Clostridia bacterium]|nr:UDP-N-acetylmuramoyl-L-alanyl-D-glutamate--2,6-diaminopimelate ligase [Clostridia bacterium]MBR1704904.1 UDP-N-acetylmuramoyl-L-alanyl-D-glutamate--2,6-diaminopimelate ligase [Clostridia bacterium]
MKLATLLAELPVVSVTGPKEALEGDIVDIVYDSRKAVPGTVFVCMTGAETDGHKYARSAYDAGCRAFVLEAGHEETASLGDVPETPVIVTVENSRVALAKLSDTFFEHPSGELKVIGITGTKGKTSITYILQSVLDKAGVPTGLIGTAGATWLGKQVPTVNTTPESYELQKLLRQMADDGVKAVAIEVSSLGVKWHRTDFTEFFCGIFTNISPDHIGGHEHKTYEEYYGFKKAFFDLCTQAAACGDDPSAEDMLEAVPGRKIFYGLGEGNEFRAEHMVPTRSDDFMGIRFDFLRGGTKEDTFEISLPGDFSVHNALAVLAVCELMGLDLPSAKEGLRTVRVPGRCQIKYLSKDFGIIIDYAHNDISLAGIINTVRAYEPKRIITLFGSVGDRAQLRREELGTTSGKLADFTVITEDDPGFEDPKSIAEEIATYVEAAGGAGKYVVIPDREEAVAYAVAMLEPGDFLLCCGKGHERFMKVRGKKEPFNEETCIEEALAKRGIRI